MRNNPMKKRFISVFTALLCVWLAGCEHTDDPNLNKDTENGSTATDTMTGSDDILTDSELDGDTDTENKPITLNQYTDTQKIEVKNANNLIAELLDKNAFLQNLQSISLLKLADKSQYQTGDKLYTIKIEEDVISIYAQYVTVNEDLYEIKDGNFNFLGEYTYYLPWL